jgi:hypothetical protein
VCERKGGIKMRERVQEREVERYRERQTKQMKPKEK